MIFLWDDWNREHAAKHGVAAADAVHVVESAAPPYPREIADGKHIVVGPDRAGRIVQVVFAYKAAEDVAVDAVSAADLLDLSDRPGAVAVYVIHVMPVEGRRKKKYRRGRR